MPHSLHQSDISFSISNPINSMKRKQSNQIDREEDDENEQEILASDIEESTQKRPDGFADTILNLLKQETGSKVPVLSGRKTSLMKQLQEEQQLQRSLEKKRLEKKQKVAEKFQSEHNVELERQLRKLATKGVVALFNAVAKAKKEIAEASLDSKEKKETHKSKDYSIDLPSRNNTTSDQQPLVKKWKVVNENATEELLLDWDKDEM